MPAGMPPAAPSFDQSGPADAADGVEAAGDMGGFAEAALRGPAADGVATLVDFVTVTPTEGSSKPSARA